MANRIEEEGARFADPDALETQVSEYMKLKSSIEFMEKRKSELREKLFAQLEQEGFEEESGNILLDLPMPIEGIVRLEKVARRSRKLNEQVADEIISRNGIEDDVYKMVRMIDEDALMACLYQDKISEEELDEMFPVSITWALMTKKK